MKQKSLATNYIFNTLKTLMGVVFPLITFPYASRILGPEGLGKVDYSQATVTYFVLIASFGISGYAVREGARMRDDKARLSDFCGEILGINCITVCIAYGLFLLTLSLPKFASYRGLMLIFSVTIVLTVISMEWLYNIFEDYRYITLRSFVFQLLSIVLLLVLVRTHDNYMEYAFVLVTAGVGSNILNFIRARKYIHIRFRFGGCARRHIRPMFMIFIMNIASSIYLVMDRTMLGYMTGDDRQVGLYAAAIKIHVVIMSFLASLRVIMTPRVAYQMQHNKKEADRLNDLTIHLAILLAVPCAVGVMLVSKYILTMLAGASYLDAVITLRILMVDLVFAALNGIMVNQIFITQRMDRQASTAVILGAVVNLISNSITIPIWGKEGAAFSTVLSEASMFLFVCIAGKSVYHIGRAVGQIVQSLLACVPMGLVVYAVTKIHLPVFAGLGICMLSGVISYFGCLFLLKNPLVKIGLDEIRKRVVKGGLR